MAEDAGLIAVLLWLASLVSALLVPIVKWLIMDSRYKPLLDVFGRETGQAIIDFAEEQWRMAVSLANETMDGLLARNIDIRKWGRMEPEHGTD